MPTIEDFDDDFEFDLPTPAAPGPAASGSVLRTSGSGPSATHLSHSGPKAPTAEETKKWLGIYPIYFDAKRVYRKCRKVAYENAALYPQSIHLAHACQTLGVKFNHEMYKTHPQDWENPGRVKVQLFDDDGKPLQAHLPNKQTLLKAMAKVIQPIAGGKPPPPPPSKPKPAQEADAPSTKTSSKRKRKNVNPVAEDAAVKAIFVRRRERLIRKTALKRGFRVDQPTEDGARFSIQSMLPPHSPALEMGALNVDMAKAMGAAAGGMPGGMGALGGMLSGLGLGGGDDDDEEDAEAAAANEVKKPLTPQERQEQMIAQMGRRQRKKVVRVGR
ncbi:signal recognition particle subunit [Tilletia horrida]|uniref:Signal recognition particle subunit n=1 Tax=Tilletia horrida TaxID=155126 RepID=A0AAN6GRM2_9BASI|nr:signal recognition particle subunit [Tilletia horrida]